MTAPKRWPKNAEAARQDALASAMEINILGRNAKAAVRQGRRELALLYISEIQLAAKGIELHMLVAKQGKEES